MDHNGFGPLTQLHREGADFTHNKERKPAETKTLVHTNRKRGLMMLKEQARYSRLANLTKLINTNLELREVLQHVTTAISEEIVQCDSVGIYLPQADGTFRGYVGKPQVLSGWTLDMHVIDLNIDHPSRKAEQGQRLERGRLDQYA